METKKNIISTLDKCMESEKFQDNIKRMHMENGVIIQLPSSVYIEDTVKLIGKCVIENGCRITGNTVIENSHIKSGTVIEDSTIINSDIGPTAHIRPLSQIKDSHIGNFVEVKKSSLNGVKAGHLSYIGDTTIEPGTNIGAGVITCNYDGVNKYKTTIGKNVFVGSDSQIIAPCIIEDDVIIAAGTTVTDKNVKKGVLAISRKKMKTIKNFYYRFFNNK